MKKSLINLEHFKMLRTRKEVPVNECLPNYMMRDILDEGVISKEEYYQYYEGYQGNEDIFLDEDDKENFII